MQILFEALQVLGSLGIFIYGMYLMTDAIQKLAGPRFKNILGGMTSNRISGIFTGFMTTSLVQSSSATTVMVVSFVNAGLLTLLQATGVIMGANIGTTVTAWLISLLGFGKVHITTIALYFIGVSFPFLFSGKPKLKTLAEFILGFGILFIGLEFLKGSVPDIKHNPEVLEFLHHYTDMGYWSYFLFIIIGTLLTITVQSSSASMAITLALLAQGWIQFDIAASMVLGENIGTTITANLAALIGNVHAKRAARFHTLFNIIGLFWILLIFPFYLQMIDYLNQAFFHFDISLTQHIDVASWTDERNMVRGMAETRGLSLFHTTFNILNTILLFAFTPFLVKIVTRFTKAKDHEDEEFKLQYIGKDFTNPPEFLIMQAKKEVASFGKIIGKMGDNVHDLLFKKDKKKRNKLIKKIKQREEFTDDLEIEIAQFLTKVTEQNLTPASSLKLRSIYRISNELERIADIFFRISKHFERAEFHKISFDDSIRKELEDYFGLIVKALKMMNENLNGVFDKVDISAVYNLEKLINSKRYELEKLHFERIENNEYSAMTGIIYLDIVKSFEKIGDHIVNINEAMKGKKGEYDD
jgi:phosphate:Na+ symporter